FDRDPAAGLVKLLALPTVRRVTRLELTLSHVYRPEVHREVFLALATANLPALTALTLMTDPVTNADLVTVLNSPSVEGLKRLTLLPTLTADAAERVAGLSGLRRLRVSLPAGEPGRITDRSARRRGGHPPGGCAAAWAAPRAGTVRCGQLRHQPPSAP